MASAETDRANSRRSFLRRHAKTIVASVVMLLAFAGILSAGGLPVLPPKGVLARADTFGVVLFVLGMLVHMLTRFARYHFLVAPLAHVPMRRIMTINAIGMALITFLPLRLGEVARPAMLREKGQLSGWAVTGTVGAERVLDGLLFAVILFVGAAIAVPHEPLPSHIGAFPIPATLVTQAARVAGLVFGVAFLLMLWFYRYRAFARRVTERAIGLVSARLATRVADVVSNLSEGLSFLTNVRHVVPYAAVSLFSIGSQIWSIQVLAAALGMPELDFTRSAVVLGLVALGFGLPNAPGFFGTVQLAIYAGLAAYVSPDKVVNEGAALVFVFYATYLGLVVLLAVLSLALEAALPQRDTGLAGEPRVSPPDPTQSAKP
ncbi:MAG TPA: lysylphosphatidylglycerol synthase transmembrane domain-containing protein [Polyangiaceae bacterium]